MQKKVKYFTLGFAVAAAGLWAAAVGNLTAFQPGTPIRSGEVNANFATLRTAVEALETGKQARISGSPCPAGQFVRGVEAGGALGCGAAGLGLPFAATADSGANAFQINNSGNAISGDSGAGGIGVAGSSLAGAGVSAYSQSGSGLEARSGSGSALVARAASSLCAVCVYQGGESGGDLISAAGPNVRSGFSFRVTSTAEVLARNFIVVSDRDAKANFKAVDAGAVLEQVARLPITRWSYKADAQAVQHIGPMAQDFHAAFGLNGPDDRHISSVDAQGVALAAIQGLDRKLERETAERRRLEAENQTLRRQLAAIEARLSRLETAGPRGP